MALGEAVNRRLAVAHQFHRSEEQSHVRPPERGEAGIAEGLWVVEESFNLVMAQAREVPRGSDPVEEGRAAPRRLAGKGRVRNARVEPRPPAGWDVLQVVPHDMAGELA